MYSTHATSAAWLVGPAVLALLTCPGAAAQDATVVFRSASPTVVVVLNPGQQSQGSGIAVGREAGQTTIATNCHVVSGAETVMVHRGNAQAPASVVHCDPRRDVALLRTRLPIPSARTRASSTLRIGEPVFAIGAPRGLELTISSGLVSQLRVEPSESAPLVQTSAPISPGSSGGGLFDAKGLLVGMTTMYLRDGQALNFAVPVDWLLSPRTENEIAADAANSPLARPQEGRPPRQTGCGWRQVSTSTDPDTKHYIDPCQVKKVGDLHLAWVLDDFSTPQFDRFGYPFLSRVLRVAFDCVRERNAAIGVVHYEEQMLAGRVVSEQTRSDAEWTSMWREIAPGTVNRKRLEAVCR